jgi:cell wall-associated NlpC family hydrolase
MKKIIVTLAAAVLLCIAAPMVTGVVVLVALLNDSSMSAALSVPSSAAGSIPPVMLLAYKRAATACPGLSWTVLAAIGTIESDNGRSPLPGVTSGHNPAGAAGPMQFEPATFAQYSRPVPIGGADPPSPYDPLDASYAAARLLCASGATTTDGLAQAVFAYNHSESYVSDVIRLAAKLAAAPPIASRSGQVATRFALGQIGTPYRWGAESPAVGFDCSGLVQSAWAAAGVELPRVAQDQFDAGPLVPLGTPLQPGDLVFFGPSGGGVTHVGIVLNGSGLMVDAPHAGATVRVESFPVTVGAPWGNDVYLGATRPGP